MEEQNFFKNAIVVTIIYNSMANIPFLSMEHAMVNVATCDDTITRSSDSSKTTPFSLVLLMRVATVL